MTDVHTQVNHLKRQIDTGAEETKQYLATLKKRVAEYDTHNNFSENASAYMQSGIDSAMKSVDELREIGTQLQAQTKTASDETICTAQNSLHKVNKALLALQEKAREYDRKFTNSKGSSVVEGIENVVNSTRQRATDGIEMASEQATRVKDMIGHKVGQVANKAGEVAGGAKYTAQVATGETVRAAEVVDEKVGVTPLVQSAVGGVTETVKNLDKRMHVSETAAKIDAKVTGGLGAKVVNKGVEMVQESIEYVTESLQHAKIVASQSPTVQKAESQVSGVAQQASDTTGAAGDKVTAAKDQAKQTMCDARQKAAETAAYAHDTAVGMATSAKEKVMGATDHTKDMAGQTADMAKARGAQASDTAHHVAGSAQQTGYDMKEGAKEKGTEMKDRTMDRAGQLGTSVKEATMGTSSGESATDKMHRTAYERQQRPNEGYLGQAASKAEQIARDTKEKMADTQSRQKSVMKDTTHA